MKASDDPSDHETTIEGGPESGEPKESTHLTVPATRGTGATHIKISLFPSNPLVESPASILADARLEGERVSKVHIVPTHMELLESNCRARDESASEANMFRPDSTSDGREGRAPRVALVATNGQEFVPT